MCSRPDKRALCGSHLRRSLPGPFPPSRGSPPALARGPARARRDGFSAAQQRGFDPAPPRLPSLSWPRDLHGRSPFPRAPNPILSSKAVHRAGWQGRGGPCRPVPRSWTTRLASRRRGSRQAPPPSRLRLRGAAPRPQTPASYGAQSAPLPFPRSSARRRSGGFTPLRSAGTSCGRRPSPGVPPVLPRLASRYHRDELRLRAREKPHRGSAHR